MRNSVVIITFLLIFSGLVLQGQNYEIKIKVKNHPNDTLIVAHHFAEKQYVADTLITDKKGNALFKGNDNTRPGLYLLMFPSKKYFEFILDEPSFSLEVDTTDFVNTLNFSGSTENSLMYKDLNYLNKSKPRTDSLVKWRDSLDKKNPLVNTYNEELKKIQEDINTYRKSLITANPGLLYTALLKSLFEPTPLPIDTTLSDDENYILRMNNMHVHFLDDIDLKDERLLRTPVLYRSLEKYLDHYTFQDPDSLIKCADELIAKTEGTVENQKYILSYLLNKYANSKIMGQDAIYVHIADNYYAKGKTPWVDSTNLYKITNGAKRMRNSLLGKTAKNLILPDRYGVMHNMYDLKNDYVILWFWDPDCGHCKKATPKLVEAYDTLKTMYDVTIYSVATENEEDKWLKYLDENNFPWVNVADLEYKSRFRDDYDITGTPRLFILDKNKKIIAKKIGPEQVTNFMANYLKMEEKKKKDRDKTGTKTKGLPPKKNN